MINHIKGKIIYKNPFEVVVETAGVGYSITIPLSTYDKLGKVGSDISIFTYLQLKDDGLKLFGFATEGERSLFKLLLTVSKIGPASAIKILSGISVPDFKSAIIEKKTDVLSKISGIGKTTAQRLVVELEKKILDLDVGESVGTTTTETKANEAILALISLGYIRSSAQEAIQLVYQNSKDIDEITVEEIIKRALKFVK